MQNFKIDNPTVVHFGKDVIQNLASIAEKFGKNVLLVYGKGSVKRNGIYDAVIEQLKKAGKSITEYEGIKPNPIIEDVDAAALRGRNTGTDLIVATGGGSVIDSAKIIALTIPVNHTGWHFMSGKAKPATAVPLVCILTLAATGTEMNPFAVVQNHATGQKLGYGHYLAYPKHSFLDPSYTASVPRNYTAYGIADLIAHALENYFGAGEASLSDRFVFSIIREAKEYGPALLSDLQNYELRARIMYAATCALNGLTGYGRVSGDWGVHSLGHIFSLLYDVPHGATLSVAYPAWMKFHADIARSKILQLGQEVFGATTVDQTINGFESLFQKIECPVRLNELNIGSDSFPQIIASMISNKVSGNHFNLKENDYEILLRLMR